MNEETIVAVYDTSANAEDAIRELEAANVSTSAISHEASTPTGSMAPVGAPEPRRQPGFWTSLFGGEPYDGASVYDRSVDEGSHVVSVHVPSADAYRVIPILERHDPIDIDERASAWGLSPDYAPGETTAPLRGEEEARIPLAKEELSVGKRLVNKGTARIRRFVVEEPVEQDVTLHSEKATIERRPASADATDADFSDKVVEVTESKEEPVVRKTARVNEEVVVRKDVADRTEKVRDTVRKEDVEVTRDDNPATPDANRLNRAGGARR